MLDYRLRRVIEDLCDDGLYQYDYSQTKPRLRLTFLLFILVFILANIYAAIKWLFVGSHVLSSKSWFIKKMVAWDKYCKFNIL